MSSPITDGADARERRGTASGPSVQCGLPITEFPDYLVNEWSEIYSIRSQKWLRPFWNGGHWQIELGRRPFYVHVLALEAHVGPRPTPQHKGLHRDDDPHHNHISNLYWGTMSDNAFDRVRNGRDHNANKVECKRGHKLAGANLQPWIKNGRGMPVV